MGNQSSVLADMVYRVFPNLEPTQHQIIEQSPSIQTLFSPRTVPTTPKSPYGRSTSFGGNPYSPSAFSTSSSFSNRRDSPTGNGPGDLYQRQSSVGINGVSAATLRMAAELAAMSAHRAYTQPKPMQMASFELAALSLRVLDIWDRLGKESIRRLKRSFKEVTGPESFLFGSADLRWRIVGTELRKELGLLTASLASLAERCDPALVDEVQLHCWNVSRKRRRSSLFEEDEEAMLMSALEALAAVTGNLKDEMEALDNLMPSSHPLRNPEAMDGAPFGPKKGGASSPAPKSPAGPSNARRQQLIRAQLATVQQLQKESLWNQDFDWTVLLLCVSLALLWHKFRDLFGRPKVEEEEVAKSLGPAGLSLHYANAVLLLDNLVQRPNVITNTSARDEVYEKLPANVKAGLRMRLRHGPQAFDSDVVLELRRTVTHMLSWMVPLAEATVAWEAERSFSGAVPRRNRKHLAETLYYADRDQFELLLIELLVALTHTLGPRKNTKAAALAQAELLGKSVQDDDDVTLPPVPHATLPKMERMNGEARPGAFSPRTPRALTPRPNRAPKPAKKMANGEHADEEEPRKPTEEVREEDKTRNGGDEHTEHEEEPAVLQEKHDNEELPSEEHKEEGALDGDLSSKPMSPIGSPSRRRRPAPRPPPGFGGNQANRVMYDFRPTLMG